MVKRKKFSLIIPTYEGYKGVGRCLGAIDVQTDPSYELLVINDGMDERMRKLVKDCSPDAFYHEMPHYGRKGGALSVDYGISQATGEFIYILNGDNTITPDFIERMYDPKAHVLTCWVRMNDTPGIIRSGERFNRGKFDRANYAILTEIAQKVGYQQFCNMQQDDWHFFNACMIEIQRKGSPVIHQTPAVLAEHN